MLLALRATRDTFDAPKPPTAIPAPLGGVIGAAAQAIISPRKYRARCHVVEPPPRFAITLSPPRISDATSDANVALRQSVVFAHSYLGSMTMMPSTRGASPSRRGRYDAAARYSHWPPAIKCRFPGPAGCRKRIFAISARSRRRHSPCREITLLKQKSARRRFTARKYTHADTARDALTIPRHDTTATPAEAFLAMMPKGDALRRPSYDAGRAPRAIEGRHTSRSTTPCPAARSRGLGYMAHFGVEKRPSEAFWACRRFREEYMASGYRGRLFILFM